MFSRRWVCAIPSIAGALAGGNGTRYLVCIPGSHTREVSTVRLASITGAPTPLATITTTITIIPVTTRAAAAARAGRLFLRLTATLAEGKLPAGRPRAVQW